jgi:hypothetical protein
MTITKVTDSVRDTVGVAKGGTGLTAVGTSGNVLTSNGSAWTSSAPAGGGAWTLIGTQVASSSASLTQTGLDSTYDTYAIAISDIEFSDNDVRIDFRVGDSGGIETGSSYRHHIQLLTSASTSYSSRAEASGTEANIGRDIGTTTAGEGYSSLFYLHGPGDSTTFPHWTGTWWSSDGDRAQGGTLIGSFNSVITLDRVQIIPSAGTFTTGRMTVWGISHG